MKKLAALILAFSFFSNMYAQDSTVTIPRGTDTLSNLRADTATVVDTLPIIIPPSDTESADQPAAKKMGLPALGITSGSRDHLLLQFGVDTWTNKPDSIKTKGLSRSFNVYFMYDFPLKNNPHISVAAGIGISTSNIYFSDTYIDITGKYANRLSFSNVHDSTHFKKYKLLTTYLEVPAELRYVADPLHPKKSFKAAAGLKVGTLVSASTKGKTLLNGNGQSINNYIQKEKSKRFFNGTRVSVIGRVGYGSLSLFGSYQVNAFVKQGFGPDIRPFTVGITLSGL